MKKPAVHLICNAHLDPVWQWRWEEGCSEALSTFRTAVDILREHPTLIFNHNEAVLYRWVRDLDPALFRAIQSLVAEGRWCISGGWYLQPDVNMPGSESIIRHITEGRRFFREYFHAEPKVAYNFDSFGHTGGLPQILLKAGYEMYIHMRPQPAEQDLPSDLYRWRGIDGSEILTLRITVGLYHTERDNIEERMAAGTERALSSNRDVPVFWGIGNHGGGATREDLKTIDGFIQKEKRVDFIHSTPEMLHAALRDAAASAPVVEGDLQRVFTGCYTSLSRIKRRAQQSLGELVQAEALRTATWWIGEQEYPEQELSGAWRDHLFNDFHDILPGSCTQPAEQDALDQYGRVAETVRRMRMGAAVRFNAGKVRTAHVPITVLNTNPSLLDVPVEAECMLDLRPKWSGVWHLRLFDFDGNEIPCQEGQPESLLPFNGWRRKVTFVAAVPPLGSKAYKLEMFEGGSEPRALPPALAHRIDEAGGLLSSIDAGGGRECLRGLLPEPLVVEDDGDSWGSGKTSYRIILGRFRPRSAPRVIERGPIRSVTESTFAYDRSELVLHTVAYPRFPVIEFRFRVLWSEICKRLKLSFPTVLRPTSTLCEVPAGVIGRPCDGDEHVHGRWLMLRGEINGRDTAFAVVNSGQHGFDCRDGEIRLSVLRSAAYCHEQGLAIGESPARKYMDRGVHEFRILVTAGDWDPVRRAVTGLADWLSAPPVVYSHLPIGEEGRSRTLFESIPPTIRVTACKRSWDGHALIARFQEMGGSSSEADIVLAVPRVAARAAFKPYEIKTIRFERSGSWRETGLIDEE